MADYDDFSKLYNSGSGNDISMLYEDVLDRLPDESRKLIELRVGIGEGPYTIEELADRLCSTPLNVRNRETVALNMVRYLLKR